MRPFVIGGGRGGRLFLLQKKTYKKCGDTLAAKANQPKSMEMDDVVAPSIAGPDPMGKQVRIKSILNASTLGTLGTLGALGTLGTLGTLGALGTLGTLTSFCVQVLSPVTSADYPALAVWQNASNEIFVSASSFIGVCIDQDGDAARSRLSAMLRKNPGLKPVSNIAKAPSNDEWTFSFTISSGQDVILLSLDAMDYVLQKLAGKVKNKKALLQAYVERCRSSFPFRKRGPVLCISTCVLLLFFSDV